MASLEASKHQNEWPAFNRTAKPLLASNHRKCHSQPLKQPLLHQPLGHHSVTLSDQLTRRIHAHCQQSRRWRPISQTSQDLRSVLTQPQHPWLRLARRRILRATLESNQQIYTPTGSGCWPVRPYSVGYCCNMIFPAPTCVYKWSMSRLAVIINNNNNKDNNGDNNTE